MGLFGKNDPNVVKIRGVKIGPPDPNGWTREDYESWEKDEEGYPTGRHSGVQCNYEGKIAGRCKRMAESGNARCHWHIGKVSK